MGGGGEEQKRPKTKAGLAVIFSDFKAYCQIVGCPVFLFDFVEVDAKFCILNQATGFIRDLPASSLILFVPPPQNIMKECFNLC